MGEFSGNPNTTTVVPINRSVRREAARNGFKVSSTGEIEQMKVDAVLERREMRSKNSAWNDHVEGLGSTTDEALNAKKREYEERRQYIREILNASGTSGGLRPTKQGRELYTPKNISSQHSIALGTPSDRRAEYDARRKFLKSNLTEDERGALAKSRGQSRAAAFGLDGTN